MIRTNARRVGGIAVTALAGLLVYLELVLPDQITRLPPGNPVVNALIRIPLEALVAVAVLLVLPARPRRILATVLGLVLGLLTVVKFVDIGFYRYLAREFDPVNDWVLFADGYRYLEGAYGGWGANGIAVAAVLLGVATLTLTVLSVRRLTRLLAAHAEPTRHTVFALSSAWVVLTVLGVQIVGGIPIASQAAADLAHDTALKVPQDLRDRKAFTAEVREDAFRDVPPAQLLTALRGKDVIVGFVESYGRDALENPEFNGQVLDQLRADQDKLTKKGFAARSGFLTSSTFGGGSWLAHSTFLTGLWIDSQQRYRSVVSSDRLTLTRAFKKAGYRTAGIEPGVTYAWPEAQFYGYDQVWDSHTLDYHGPSFSWSTMPDQFVMSRFQQLEYAKAGRGPLLGEITLTSSHTPWNPVPTMLPWDQVGDGSVYGPMVANAAGAKRDNHSIRLSYAKSIAYSVDSLISYIDTYGDDNLVMVFLGDHQPNTTIVGQHASKDVPISIVAKDPKVFDRIKNWGWTDGLTPAPGAPVWPMNQFRDRFLTAYSPEDEPH